MNKLFLKKSIIAVIFSSLCLLFLSITLICNSSFIKASDKQTTEMVCESDTALEEKYTKLTYDFCDALIKKDAVSFYDALDSKFITEKAEAFGLDNSSKESYFQAWYNILTLNSNENNITGNVTYQGYDGNTADVTFDIRNDVFRVTWHIFFNNNDKICTIYRDDDSINFTLKKTDKFQEHKVEIGEYKLKGILTLPKDVEKPAVVILIPGSNYADATAGGMFNTIAYHLGNQGIATLRFNERFYQYPELAATNNTVYTESIDDVCAAIDMLLTDDRISADNIFLGGQSLGGKLSPKIAELRPEVRGIISLAGSPRNLIDTVADQYNTIYEEINNEEEFPYTMVEKIINDIRNISAPGDGMSGIEFNDNMTEEEKSIMELYQIYRKYSDSYWLSCHQLDTEGSLNRLNKPMLILQGEKDVNVLATKDYVEWQRLLKGRDNCHFKLYPGLNHHFKVQQYPGFLNALKDYSTPGTIESYVIDDMAEFIHKYTVK